MPLIPITDLIADFTVRPVIDVRSEGEFEQGHIPGAVNIPLLDNADRKAVGTCYKLHGNEAAVLLGYKLAGPKFYNFIKEARKVCRSKEAWLHCWRGGLRSKIAATILEDSGLHIYRLKGGYKSYRNWVLQTLEMKIQVKVLGGLTGSGKTTLLHLLKENGEQIIDLEGLAHHKGSAFGGIGQPAQPTQEQFENNLGVILHKLDPDRRVWIEDESRAIGRMVIPPVLWKQMREAPLYEIVIPKAVRHRRIMEEYSQLDPLMLEEKTATLKKRLGDKRTKEVIAMLQEKDLGGWASALLDYYDKTYAHGQDQREENKRNKIELKEPTDIINFLKTADAIKV
jgi:tRNA 2-selenouridine synthase